MKGGEEMLEDLDKVGEIIKNVGTCLLGIASFITAIAGLAEK